ncbi:MaoC family dehydratase N-terminal domain-containing protein [Salicibibacter cibarius]|uniref:MaoC family dehydratase N-terminal domain-containing protein n=1 Tax=Salicibibacter cibarius TaxID=2743000 RepID=A0A7T6Z3N2_9BACI|nr:MaoC family dehydratase N-terminal domain-containing protein [Salicibibacter cibarius]QQK76425.1 MaoC family dehydratase N-terminal domain-containing protein [Salicibibacter cibarius]
MSDKQQLIGLELEPYHFDVEKGKIKELAMAIGDDNPIYFSEDAAKKEGFEGIPIPLTFLQAIDLWGGYTFDKKVEVLDINPVKVLHGEQEYEIIGDIYAGDHVTVTSKVIDVRVKEGASGGMNLITTENIYTNQHDKKVAIARSTTIERH